MSDERLWSVEIEIGNSERVAMEYAGMQVVGPHDFMVAHPYEGYEAPTTVHIDARAAEPDAAVIQALASYSSMRRVAQLPPDPVPNVLTVARVAGKPWPWDRFIFEADDMLAQRRFALAVVAAQIHCEMYIRHALRTVAERDGTPIAKLAPGLIRSWSLTDRVGPDIFEALLGVRPTAASGWEKYKTHVHRRNSIVHQGADVTEKLAEQSVEAVVEMVRFVQERLGAVMEDGA